MVQRWMLLERLPSLGRYANEQLTSCCSFSKMNLVVRVFSELVVSDHSHVLSHEHRNTHRGRERERGCLCLHHQFSLFHSVRHTACHRLHAMRDLFIMQHCFLSCFHLIRTHFQIVFRQLAYHYMDLEKRAKTLISIIIGISPAHIEKNNHTHSGRYNCTCITALLRNMH